MKQTKNSLLAYGEKIDLSDKEEWREYRFPNGEIIHINNPQFLIVSDNGHRVVARVMSHYIPYGWIELKWKCKDGRGDNFICEEEEK
jgi:hypothetical protein